MSANTKFMTGLLIGAAAGAAITALLTSEKGQEILGNIKDFISKAEDNIRDVASDFEEKVSATADTAKQYGENFGQNA